MSRTVQKKIKFTKGMITPSLMERNDLPAYESSAQNIVNYECLPWGGLKARPGLEQVNSYTRGVYMDSEGTWYYDDITLSLEDSIDDIRNYKRGDVLKTYDFSKIITVGRFTVNLSLDDSYSNLRSLSIKIQYSKDGIKWTDGGELIKQYENYGDATSYARYVRLVLNSYSLYEDEETKLSLLNVKMEVYPVRLIPFIYNIDTKYVIMLQAKRLYIVNCQTGKMEVMLTGHYFNNIYNVKYTQNENVMIFTETTQAPWELRRGSITWTMSKFNIKNIPYYNFNGETSKTNTVGITPNYASGAIVLTADSDAFTSDMVGQQIDGNSGRFKITAYESATKVSGYTIIPFLNTDKITSWTLLTGWEPVWSDTRGWPGACLFYQQRLWFAGSTQRPATVWGSRTAIYNDFQNIGNYDNDGIDQDLNTTEQIINLVSNRGLQIFTTGDEWTASETSLTPNDFAVVKNSNSGCSALTHPVTVGGTTYFLDKTETTLYSYVYNYDQAAYVTSNSSILTELINQPTDMTAYSGYKNRGDYLYILNASGDIISICLNVEQEVNAPSVINVQKGYYYPFLAVTAVGDELYFLLNSSTGHYVIAKYNKNYYTDFPSTYTNKGTLSGKTSVYYDVVGDDEYIGRFRGSSTLPKTYDTLTYGKAIMCEVTSNPIAINGRSTSTFKRISKAVVTTRDGGELTFNGKKKKSEDGIFEYFATTGYSKQQQFTITSSYYPFEILSVLLYVNYGAG